MPAYKADSQLSRQITQANQHRWQRYPDTYRMPEVKTIASWINKGESGCVVGVPGVGRSTLLDFIYHRPEALTPYLTVPPEHVVIIPIDLNILPDDTIATLYRVILRAFYGARKQFDNSLQQIISDFYQRHAASHDPFLPQSALLELLALFQAREARLVWILNHFDEFLKTATLEMTRTLRSLRDSYKGTLCYLAGMITDMAHLSDLEVGRPLHHILDVNVYWVGSLNKTDANHMFRRELRTAVPAPTAEEIQSLWHITGGYPTLIKIVAHWWMTDGRQQDQYQWIETLLGQRNVQYRLMCLWDGLTQEEQFALSELQKAGLSPPSEKVLHDTLPDLQKKGICYRECDNWHIFSTLFSTYVAKVEGRGRGRIWEDPRTGELFQGRTALTKLTPLERETLRFFTQYPHVQHTYTNIFEAAWPEDVQHASASNESIQQMIRGIRKKIEPNPAKPVYVVTWRGQPEGGYQFFPEGRPSG
ncbi:MAG: hypothetical protein CSA11_07560 [Chloroflexi bacterium]|nr:MAG: hypothetical protein CSA11_07560 [Chloroflexota bacterium]